MGCLTLKMPFDLLFKLLLKTMLLEKTTLYSGSLGSGVDEERS